MWKISADTGGTFTDCLAETPAGEIRRVKVLSSSALRGRIRAVSVDRLQVTAEESWGAPDDFLCRFSFSAPFVKEMTAVSAFDAKRGVLMLSRPLPPGNWVGEPFLVQSPEEAPVLAARLATGTLPGQALPDLALRIATTRATNALLEGKGAKTVFFVTAGFADLIRIGTQQRPDIFALNIQKPPPLHAEVVEVRERLDSAGKMIESIAFDALEEEVGRLVKMGRKVAAVAFLHSYRNPEHEKQMAAFLRKRGFQYISCSHELAPSIKILPRAETAVVDASLSPIMETYLDSIEEPVGRRIRIMTSAGGLLTRAAFRPSDSLLSGPAGGVVGAAAAGRRAGFTKILSFDMGGTSSDVARFDGDFEYSFEQRVGDAHLLVPSLKIETVASGGGSVCSFDGNQLRVGPESAGASPGPACYGGGGPLSLTDVHLLLGRIDHRRFGVPVFPDQAHERLAELSREIAQAGPTVPAEADLLEGFLTIANERMADAIRKISLREGVDPSEYALVAFGGAGGLHACAVSEELGIGTVVWPKDAGILSAVGLQRAAVERFAQKQVLQVLSSDEGEVSVWVDELGREAIEALKNEEEISGDEIVLRRRLVDLRLRGQETGISIEYGEGNLAERFAERYREVFGYYPEGREIEITSIRVVASNRSVSDGTEEFPRIRMARLRDQQTGRWSFYGREELDAGDSVSGPAVIQDSFSTFVVEAGWEAIVGSLGAIRIDRLSEIKRPGDKEESEVVELELYTNRLRVIAEEMGVQLQRTALSTNIKERLDFSCAILDADGFLVVNAPHVPVHLGAMGLCVREVMRHHRFRQGDMILTNHPGIGGSHLPDLTLIAPVFVEGSLVGFVANRAHHAEMGGIRPGSMPPRAGSLVEEGVVISPMLLFDQGVARYEVIEEVLATAPYPSRAVADNLTDLQAQAAANLRGVDALLRLAAAGGRDRLVFYLEKLKEQSAAAAAKILEQLGDRERRARQELDDGFAIEVTLRRENERLVFDFAGTSPQHPGSFNATPAIVRSAVLYVIRLLVGEEIPLNEGLMERVEIRLPHGCLLYPIFGEKPEDSPAVVAGNVETSQRLVDTLLLAFGAVACSQGTMNNFVFGNESYSYYETICGGSGAGEGFNGVSAVQTHMTNTAITDPEVLEFRYPVRLERFAIRKRSGGDGRWQGGDGIVREFLFLEPMSVSLLTQHRVQKPYGLRGGQAGAAGRQTVIRTSGEKVELSSSAEFEAEPGDRIRIETPGGGGWGAKC